MNTPDGARWTLLCEAPNKWEALFIQGRLQSAGIAVHIVSESAAELYGITHGTLALAKIYVPESSVQAARDVLAEPEPGVDENPGDDPHLATDVDPEDEH